MHGGRDDVAVRIDAAFDRQQGLELSGLVLRQIGERVGELEVDRVEADDAGAGDMRDLHACRLQSQDAGLGAAGVGRQIDQQIELVGRDALGRFALGGIGERREMVA